MVDQEQDWIDKYRAALDQQPQRRSWPLLAGLRRLTRAFGRTSSEEANSVVPKGRELPQPQRTEVHLSKENVSEKPSPETRGKRAS